MKATSTTNILIIEKAPVFSAIDKEFIKIKKTVFRMKKYFMPDKIYASYSQIDADVLLGDGIHAVIFDIDNTLAPYEEAEPNEKVREYFNKLHECGIKTAFVSNNHGERVELFSRTLNTPFFPDSKKPLGKNMKVAIKLMGEPKERTAIIGDQVLTDVWAGKRQKIRTYLVPPINDKKNLFFRFKRMLEKPIIRKYYKCKGEDIKNAEEGVVRTWGKQ